MHTKISSDNHYGYDRWGFAWEYVETGSSAHLDFGCNDGKFMNALKDKKIARLAGVDVSAEAIDRGKGLYPDLAIVHIRQAADLAFKDGTFDSITILDVLEHVSGQSELLTELNRVLKDEGKLIVTVPGRHIFSFLDMGNFKFRFPDCTSGITVWATRPKNTNTGMYRTQTASSAMCQPINAGMNTLAVASSATCSKRAALA